MAHGEFSVWQFFENGAQERVREWVDHIDACLAFYHYTHNVAANMGITRRVIITDGGDFTNAEWKYGEGNTYPPEWVGVDIDRGIVEAMKAARARGEI